MISDLALAVIMVTATVTVHFFGILFLLYLLRQHGGNLKVHHSSFRQGFVILVVMLGIFAIHTVEIWLYAVLYFALGALPNFETALYFSTVTFSSVGYGDVVLSPQWRVFGAIEAPNGLILIGWSTAFLISLMSRLRTLEHDWLE
ncbi:MAG: two pore domain potassium channel family protein [Alphaproteobacteria bacterium]|nr:two pore domain potassium channel family protein [Alphaproteobacteria bacterium]